MSDLDPRLEHLVARLRALPEPDTKAMARLRAELRRVAAPPVRRSGWLVLSPLRAAAYSLVIVAATSAVWFGAGWTARETPGSPSRVPTQFVFVSERAGHVSLVGDFNDWDPTATPLKLEARGVWSAVVPLEPGRVAYSFVVDGAVWHADPQAPVSSNDFGRPSSVMFVAHSGTRQ